jgi:hypothetical protein
MRQLKRCWANVQLYFSLFKETRPEAEVTFTGDLLGIARCYQAGDHNFLVVCDSRVERTERCINCGRTVLHPKKVVY